MLNFVNDYSEGVYEKLCKNALDKADRLKQAFRLKGYQFYIDSPTNQIFILLENRHMEHLKQRVKFSFWEKADADHTVVRFATSWATTQEDVESLIELL